MRRGSPGAPPSCRIIRFSIFYTLFRHYFCQIYPFMSVIMAVFVSKTAFRCRIIAKGHFHSRFSPKISQKSVSFPFFAIILQALPNHHLPISSAHLLLARIITFQVLTLTSNFVPTKPLQSHTRFALCHFAIFDYSTLS